MRVIFILLLLSMASAPAECSTPFTGVTARRALGRGEYYEAFQVLLGPSSYGLGDLSERSAALLMADPRFAAGFRMQIAQRLETSSKAGDAAILRRHIGAAERAGILLAEEGDEFRQSLSMAYGENVISRATSMDPDEMDVIRKDLASAERNLVISSFERRQLLARLESVRPESLPVLSISEPLWQSITEESRVEARARYEVDLTPDGIVGVIVDVQVVDESISASSAGSELGSVIGSAAYVDKAFWGDSGDYSAKEHLGAAVLGAVLGSTFDSPAAPQVLVRYTVRGLDGELRYVDERRIDGFRRSPGECINARAGQANRVSSIGEWICLSAVAGNGPVRPTDGQPSSSVEGAARPPDADAIARRIAVLKQLMDAGVITPEEYAERREVILGGV